MWKIALPAILIAVSAQAEQDCPSCTATTESCVEAVCGKSPAGARQQIVDQAVREAKGPEAQSALQAVVPELESYVEASLKAGVRDLEELELVLKNPEIKIDPRNRFMHNLLFFVGHLDALPIKIVVKGKEVSIEVDEAETEKRLAGKGLAPAERKWIVNVGRTIYQGSMVRKSMRAGALFASPEAFLRSEHPEMSLAQALRSEIRETNKILSEAMGKKIFSPVLEVYLADMRIQLQELEAKNEYFPQDLTKVMKDQALIGVWAHAAIEGGAVLEEREPTPVAELLSKNGVQSRVRAIRKALADSEKVAAAKRRIRETCLANLGFRWASSVEGEAAVDRTMTRAKDLVRGSVLPLFSRKSADVLGKMLDTVFFAATETRKGGLASASRKLKAARESKVRDWEIYERLDSGDRAQVLALTIHTVADWKDEDQWFAQLGNECGEFEVSTQLTDRTYTTSGNVVPSWISLKRPEFGLGVAAHELGHLIYRKMSDESISTESRKKFDGALDCLDMSHGSKPPRFHADEDFADLVADLSMPKSGPVWACVLIEPQQANPYALMNRDPSDTHSSSVLRVMRSHQRMKGKLPEACLPAGRTSSLLTVAPSSCL